jgi:hypothetical protein
MDSGTRSNGSGAQARIQRMEVVKWGLSEFHLWPSKEAELK